MREAVERGVDEGDGPHGRVGRCEAACRAIDEDEDVAAPGDFERGVVCGADDMLGGFLQLR